MTFFVDTNVIVYSRAPSRYRVPCGRLVAAVADGRAGGRTSVAVLEEIWHLELSGKAGDLEGLTERARTVFAPLLPVTDDVFRLALSLELPKLGANDRLLVATCFANDIGTLVSADSGFDRVPGLRRIDPLATALDELLAAP